MTSVAATPDQKYACGGIKAGTGTSQHDKESVCPRGITDDYSVSYLVRRTIMRDQQIPTGTEIELFRVDSRETVMNPHDRGANHMHDIEQRKATRPSTLAAIALLALYLATGGAALAAGEHGGGHASEGDGHGHEGGHSFSFGAPADASEADRTITVTALDTMKFEPETVSIAKETTVRFVVENVGRLQHSFTLAKPTQQQEHEEEMQGMSMDRMAGHMDDDPNGIVVQPGDTGSITWRFTEATTIEFACHIPGHYPAGMKGSISVGR